MGAQNVPVQKVVELSVFQKEYFGIKGWMWLVGIVVGLIILDKQGIVDVPLIGGNKKALRRLKRN